jgi:processive 1,2-diacylglycerol beta-glucosyltransferase
MLIHHLVPGQEEGNLQLLQRLNAGDIAETPADLTAAISQMLTNDAAKWRKMKARITSQGSNDGAITASKFILSHL